MKFWYRYGLALSLVVSALATPHLAESDVRIPVTVHSEQTQHKAVHRPQPLASRCGRPYHAFTPMMDRTAHWIQRYNPEIGQQEADEYVSTIWIESKVDHVDPLLVVSLVAQESAFRWYATSKAGAQGLGQLMNETAPEVGVTDPYDADDNLRGCVKLVGRHLCVFHGNVPNALAAYNAGAGAVQHYGGIPPYHETRVYVHRIMSNYGSLQRELYAN